MGSTVNTEEALLGCLSVAHLLLCGSVPNQYWYQYGGLGLGDPCYVDRIIIQDATIFRLKYCLFTSFKRKMEIISSGRNKGKQRNRHTWAVMEQKGVKKGGKYRK